MGIVYSRAAVLERYSGSSRRGSERAATTIFDNLLHPDGYRIELIDRSGR